MRLKEGVITKQTIIRDGVPVELEPIPEIKHAMQITEQVSRLVAKREAVITSILDGEHMAGSKHYQGAAFDLREWIYRPQQIKTIIKELKQRLGADYDIVDEKTHIHIEYDPK